MLLECYKGKTVLVTGHTGFKGSWLCTILKMAGASVVGYALNPPTNPNLFQLAQVENGMVSIEGDIRDLEKLKGVFFQYQPEFVFHLAAQPIVRESYNNPVLTYETNVMGTVNLLECVRTCPSVQSVLNVTTDKVYENKEWSWGYRENEPLDGADPYSNSKSCSELITHSYKKSFFDKMQVKVSTARAGNVIGGGDFGKDRIIPDCVRAALNEEKIGVRNPYSIRPYQHVLEPLGAYLLLAEKQLQKEKVQGYYNVGPDEGDCLETGALVELFCKCWGDEAKWESQAKEGPHEAVFLKLDCSLIKQRLHWKPKWDIQKAVEKTVEWTKVYQKQENLAECMVQQIKEYFQ